MEDIYNWVSNLNLIDKKHIKMLKDFNSARNIIVHGRYIVHGVEKDWGKYLFLTNLMLSVCDFLDSTGVKRKYNQKQQEEIITYYEKEIKKLENLYDKKSKP